MIFGIIVLEQVESVIKSVLTTYHDHIASWGLCIILLTFTVRLVILPLTIKQLRSMAAMQTIQPKVKQLQNKYKGKTGREDKQEMQKELMELYKEHGVNPFASCLPLVAQLPVFIGLYQVLRNQIEPTPIMSFLGIDDIFQKLSSDRRHHRVPDHRALRGHDARLDAALLVRDRPAAEVHVRGHADLLHPVRDRGPGRRDDLLDHDQHLDDLPAGRHQAHDGPSAEPASGDASARAARRAAARRPQGHGQPHPARRPGAGRRRRERTSEEAPRGGGRRR